MMQSQAVLSPRESGQFIASVSEDVQICPDGVKAVAKKVR